MALYFALRCAVPAPFVANRLLRCNFTTAIHYRVHFVFVSPVQSYANNRPVCGPIPTAGSSREAGRFATTSMKVVPTLEGGSADVCKQPKFESSTTSSTTTTSRVYVTPGALTPATDGDYRRARR